MQLVDGGVSDNSGVTWLLDANLLSTHCPRDYRSDLERWKSDLVISSDADKPFSSPEDKLGVIGSLAQSIDALYAKTGPLPVFTDDPKAKTYVGPAARLNPNDLYWKEGEVDMAILEHFALLSKADQKAFLNIVINEKGSDDNERPEAFGGLPNDTDSDDAAHTRLHVYISYG